jgi:hypothetical protein
MEGDRRMGAIRQLLRRLPFEIRTPAPSAL